MLRHNPFKGFFFSTSKLQTLISDIPIHNMRNFCIIAHIDHGKSTLADRLIEICRNAEVGRNQLLDKLKVEQERGITVKAQTSSLIFEENGEKYLLNLVDTPGHSDFAYEVERALKACEGALLIVDAAQGVQAQTFAHFRTAKELKQLERELFGSESNFKFLPVLNKIDLEGADPDMAELQVYYRLGIETTPERISAKTGEGVKKLISRLVKELPPPAALNWGANAPQPISIDPDSFRGFIFDSWFEPNRGVYFLVRVFNGKVTKGNKLILSNNSTEELEVREVGVMAPDKHELTELVSGQVGYILLNLKDASESAKNLGETLLSSYTENSDFLPLPNFQDATQLVFASIYPETPDEFRELSTGISKLVLEDPSVSVELESSPALGSGFRCGFLGTLHLDIFKQRLQDEYAMNCITTFPTVLYKAIPPKGEPKFISSPVDAPEFCEWEEPWAKVSMITREKYERSLMKLAEARRGQFVLRESLDDDQLELIYDLPLSEVITDFNDQLKSISSGFASLDYKFLDYRPADILKLVMFITNEPVDALSFLVHESRAYDIGKKLCTNLKTLVPRQLYTMKIQARIGPKTIASETIKSTGKNVLSKCYGGDYSRKRKLIEKQKAGKKKMRDIGKVSLDAGTINKLFKI